jgi:hypothetical protein
MRANSRSCASGMQILRFVIGIMAAFFPERYRSRFAWGFASAQAAVTCGALQLLACVGLLIYRYLVFANQRLMGVSTHAMQGAAESGGETAVMGMGIFVLAEYLIHPLTLLLLYFAVEGLVRASAALITGEVVPTLPLQLIALAHGKAAAVHRERELGPPVADLVQPGSGDFALVIASCRPKTWNRMSTICYKDRFYELVREEAAQPPRRWVYVLRKRPEGKVVRGEIYHYTPEEALPKAEAASAAE